MLLVSLLICEYERIVTNDSLSVLKKFAYSVGEFAPNLQPKLKHTPNPFDTNEIKSAKRETPYPIGCQKVIEADTADR